MVESAYEELACAKAEADGWLVRKLQWVGRRGGPDRFFLKNGRIVLIEFKRPGKSVEEGSGQSREIQRLIDAGAEVHSVNTHIQALRLLGVKYGRS